MFEIGRGNLGQYLGSESFKIISALIFQQQKPMVISNMKKKQQVETIPEFKSVYSVLCRK